MKVPDCGNRRCMARFYILGLIYVMIIANIVMPTLEDMRRDADSMHSLLKQYDQDRGLVLQIINTQDIKEKYLERKKQMNETKQTKFNEIRTPEPKQDSQPGSAPSQPNRPVPSGKPSDMMPDEIFLPDDIDSAPSQIQRVSRQEGSLDQDMGANHIDPVQLSQERRNEQDLFQRMLQPDQKDRIYENYDTAIPNKEFQDGKFNPQTKNDFLTQIEAKRHRLHTDKLLLKNLNDKIMRALGSTNPDVTIDQEDLYDLIVRGVIDQNQAFLIYELFHHKYLQTEELVTLENDSHVFFNQLPVCLCLHGIMILIGVNFFLLQIYMKQEPSLLLQFTAAKIAYSYAISNDSSGKTAMTFVAHSIFQMILVRLSANLSIAVGFDPNDTEFMRILEEARPTDPIKDSLYKLLFTVEMMVVSYLSSMQFQSASVWLFFSFYVGFFVYRLWSIFYPYFPTAQKVFPFFNLSSSACIILVVTSLIEGSQIYSELFEQDPSQTAHESEKSSSQSVSNATLNCYVFGFLIALIAIGIKIYMKGTEFKRSSEILSLRHYIHFQQKKQSSLKKAYADEMLSLQGKKYKCTRMATVFMVFSVHCATMAMLGCIMGKRRVFWCAVYCQHELICDVIDSDLSWVQRRNMLIDWVVRKIYIWFDLDRDKSGKQIKDEKENDSYQAFGGRHSKQVIMIYIAANYLIKAYIMYPYTTSILRNES